MLDSRPMRLLNAGSTSDCEAIVERGLRAGCSLGGVVVTAPSRSTSFDFEACFLVDFFFFGVFILDSIQVFRPLFSERQAGARWVTCRKWPAAPARAEA